jgi:4-amino-4-deoxy-L-arabinose transferase-like glycosyltransferase
MPKPAARFWCLVLLICIELAIGLPWLDRVPRISVDEAWDAAIADSIAEQGRLRQPFVEQLGGMEVHYLPNRLTLPFFCAGIFKVAGCSIFTGRLGSQFFALVAVAALYALSSKWFGYRQAFLITLLCILQPWFFQTSRFIRPEIYYCALSVVYCLLLVLYFESQSRIRALGCGLTAGVLALTHVNGIFLTAAASIAAAIWLRNGKLRQLLLWGAMGFGLAVLPYVIYVWWAAGNEHVNLFQQIQAVNLLRNPVRRELGRWKRFLVFPTLLPLGPIMAAAWLASWYKSSREEKFTAAVVTIYPVMLLLATVNGEQRYLAVLVPYWSILTGRLIWRVANWSYSIGQKLRPGIALAGCIIVTYVGISAALVGHTLFSLRNARFDRVVDKIVAVIGPDAIVHADPIFWFARDRLNYGPHLVSYESRKLRDYVPWYRSKRFKYAVRTSWYVCPPDWAQKPSQRMPDFRENKSSDCICRLFGTKIKEFHDPYYGPIVIYKLDWTKIYLLP